MHTTILLETFVHDKFAETTFRKRFGLKWFRIELKDDLKWLHPVVWVVNTKTGVPSIQPMYYITHE
jgi:hypothetical protein